MVHECKPPPHANPSAIAIAPTPYVVPRWNHAGHAPLPLNFLHSISSAGHTRNRITDRPSRWVRLRLCEFEAELSARGFGFLGGSGDKFGRHGEHWVFAIVVRENAISRWLGDQVLLRAGRQEEQEECCECVRWGFPEFFCAWV